VTTPEIIGEIHELILEDGRISAKSIAEQLGISRERLGSIIHEDLDMRKLSAKWGQNAWTATKKSQRCRSCEQICIFFRRHPDDFLSGVVGAHGRNLVIPLRPGDKSTINGVRHNGLPRPAQKIPSVKIRWKSSRLDFLGSRRHPPHWLSSKGPNYQRGVLLISAGATEGHFEGKTPREDHEGGFVLAQQCPGSTSTCNPEETGPPGLPVSWSPTLFSGSGPVGLPPVPWIKKK